MWEKSRIFLEVGAVLASASIVHLVPLILARSS
jgi:hypothetical protein